MKDEIKQIVEEIETKEATIELTSEQEYQIAKDIQEDLGKKEDGMTPKQVLEAYLGNPETKANVLYWANLFNERFRGNWFSLDQIVKKTEWKKQRRC